MKGSAVKPISQNLGPVVELLEHCVLIYADERILDRRTNTFMRMGAARYTFGNEAVKLWLQHPDREMVTLDQVVFDPTGRCPENCVNLFAGFEMEPKAGDCVPILDLLKHLCNDDNEAFVWVLRWLALPLQQPGTKMRSALVVHGPQGSGKNMFFEIVARMYGRYAKVVGQDQLEDKFNDWASQLLFAIGDEVVARAELYQQKNKLKTLITGTTIQINAKMMPLRTEKNHVNVVFLSNDIQPMALEQGDRRYCVVWTPEAREKEFYKRVGKCLDDGGHEAFLDYLLDLPLGDFHEFTPPPVSAAKRELIELGLKPAERFVREWVEGLITLPLRPCSTEQAFTAFKHWCGVNGVRWTGEKIAFTTSVKKTPGAQIELVVTHRVLATGGRQPIRCLVPRGCAPPEQCQSQQQWMTECEQAFEADLARFTKTAREGNA